MKKVTVEEHYNLLIREGNDPSNDPPALQSYMDKWDGQPFISVLALQPNSNILEIGVGSGRLAKKVLESGCGHFTGIDLSPSTIDKAKENLKAWNNISLLKGDFTGYQFTETFDTIYCSLTLFHFKDKRSFIKKTAGLLREKGRLVLSIPKQKEYVINCGSREVDLYPDDSNEIEALALEAGLCLFSTTDVEFAHILVFVNMLHDS